jgi:hypothetical protein
VFAVLFAKLIIALSLKRRVVSGRARACGIRESKKEGFSDKRAADGIRLPIVGSGDFGASPFFGQLSGRLSAYPHTNATPVSG